MMRLKVRTLIFGAAFLLLALFAALNWTVFAELDSLSLIFGRVSAPLGIVMLFVVGGLSAFYLLELARLETRVLLDSNKAMKELEKARTLAEKSEASRFTELHAFLEQELAEIKQLQGETLEQSETAAVDLAETVIGETEGLSRRVERLEDDPPST